MISYGITFLFIYSNLFTFGFRLREYLLFVLKRGECLSLLVGITLLIILLIKKDRLN